MVSKREAAGLAEFFESSLRVKPGTIGCPVRYIRKNNCFYLKNICEVCWGFIGTPEDSLNCPCDELSSAEVVKRAWITIDEVLNS